MPKVNGTRLQPTTSDIKRLHRRLNRLLSDLGQRGVRLNEPPVLLADEQAPRLVARLDQVVKPSKLVTGGETEPEQRVPVAA